MDFFFNIERIAKMWDSNTNASKHVGKMVVIELLNITLPQTFNLLEKNSQYLWSTIKQNSMKKRYACIWPTLSWWCCWFDAFYPALKYSPDELHTELFSFSFLAKSLPCQWKMVRLENKGAITCKWLILLY